MHNAVFTSQQWKPEDAALHGTGDRWFATTIQSHSFADRRRTKGIDRTPSFQPHLPPCDRWFASTMRSHTLIDRTLSFQPHLLKRDRWFASTTRSFGRSEAFSMSGLSDRTQRTC
ncbi:MAG: hypothetical protein KME42_05455 [Tildeniella nuda ZEHNDER 1965/U140]|nr:hypothetical protein [Tildeniella nuda ZEHNDER 1965/U140]